MHRLPAGYGFSISGQRPCVVSAVVPGSAAQHAGLKPGDYLLGVNGQPVDGAEHERVAALIGASGDSLALQVVSAEPSLLGACSDNDEAEMPHQKLAQQQAPPPPPPRHQHCGAIGPEQRYEDAAAATAPALSGELAGRWLVIHVASLQLPVPAPADRLRVVRSAIASARAAARLQPSSPSASPSSLSPSSSTSSTKPTPTPATSAAGQPTLLEVTPRSVSLADARSRSLLSLPADSLAFVCAYNEDARYFALLTVAGAVHIFRVSGRLADHRRRGHARWTAAFGLNCQPDESAGCCTQLPQVAAPIVHRLVRLFADKEAAAPPSLSYPTPPPSGPPALNRQQRQLRRPSVPIHVADSSSGTLTGLAASLNSTVRTLASGEVVQGQQQKTDVAPSTRWTTGLSALSCENLASSASSDDAESPPIVADNQRRRSGGDFGVGTGIGAKFVPAPPPLLRRRPQSAMAFGSGVVDAPDAIDDTAATGGPSDWSAGLDRLLADPTGVKLFAEFLRGEFSEENVAFWLAVERYRAIEDQEALSTEAARIVYDFIGINAPQCVNLDGATVEQLRADILDASRPPPSRHAFDKAQRHIYDLMRMDSYARFLKSSCYREAVAAAAAQRQQRPLTIGAETLDNGGGAKRRGFLASLVRGRTLRRHSDQQQQHGSRSPSPPSASALPTAAGCCRVQLADGSSALLDVRGAAGQQQRSLREALLDLCERRGLNFAAAEVRVLNDDEPDGVSGSGGLDAPLSAFAGRQIRMERRVLFRLELPAPAGRCVGVRARPAKSLRDVLRPVCGRYGLRLDRLVVCRESGFVPLGLDAPVDCVDGLRLCALPKEDFVDFHLFGDNRVPPRRRQNHQQKSAASAVKRSSIGHAVHRLLKSSFA